MPRFFSSNVGIIGDPVTKTVVKKGDFVRGREGLFFGCGGAELLQ